MTYWLAVQVGYDNEGEHRAYELEATSMEEAVEEAQRLLVATQHPYAFEGLSVIPEYDIDECCTARVVEGGEVADVDLAHVARLGEAMFQRHLQAQADWNAELERLRDELGHWRTLHARGAAPAAQVKMLEDRLQAHKNARP
jgi:hypothetical protein